MASQQLMAVKEMMRNMPRPATRPSVEQQRAGMEAGASFPAPDGVAIRDLQIAGRAARRYLARGARADRGVLYLHGGGYVIGSLNTHNGLMARLSVACNATVVGLDYRLAPEHPYPAAVEDAVAAYDFALQHVSAEHLIIAGDSAGGGLTLACLQALKARGKPMPAGAALLSPWTDLTASGESVHTRAKADPMIQASDLKEMADHYRSTHDAATPGISPLLGDLTGLPPLLIQVGDSEILLDDSTRLAQKARQSGVHAELRIFEEAFHVFQAFPDLPESDEALQEIGSFFNKVTSG
jgi:monoterpene epsilon-lactone hydrolase